MRKHRSERYRENAEAAGRRIRFAREEAHLTQEQLARRAGVGVTQISRLETHDVIEVQIGAFLAICRALGLDPYWVWYGEHADAKKVPDSS